MGRRTHNAVASFVAATAIIVVLLTPSPAGAGAPSGQTFYNDELIFFEWSDPFYHLTQIHHQDLRITGPSGVVISWNCPPATLCPQSKTLGPFSRGDYTWVVWWSAPAAGLFGPYTADSGSFTVIPRPPQITQLSPSKELWGSTVTISGAHFSEASDVSIGGTAVTSFQVVSDTQITAVVAPGTSSGTVSVTTPGGSAVSPKALKVAAPPAPRLQGAVPASGPTGGTVTVKGLNFNGATAVSFGGTPASSFTVVDSSTISAVIADGTVSGPVSVTTLGGTATSKQPFIISSAPLISVLSPPKALWGSTVTLNGYWLTGASDVSIGGTAVTSFQVVSDTQITAVVAPGTSSGTVSVTTPGGSAVSPKALKVAP